MFAIIGIVTVFAMVFGGYILAGGKMALILKALPFEMMMIGGAAVGTFLIGNGGDTVGKAAKSVGTVFGGHAKVGITIDQLLAMEAKL